MIPLSGKLKDDLRKKYRKLQNLPKSGTKKPSLSECYSCEHFEAGDNLRGSVGKIMWCVFKYYDRVKKRSMIHYANIELMEVCPKKIAKKQFDRHLPIIDVKKAIMLERISKIDS
jgi:hypothetical protein